MALRDRSPASRRWWRSPWLLAVAAVVLAAAGAGYAVSRDGAATPAVTCGKGATCSPPSSSPPVSLAAATLTVDRTSPADGATGVPSNAAVTVDFSSAVGTAGTMPSFTPPVAGTWLPQAAHALVFTPSAPFVPFVRYSLTIPGGPHGVKGVAGGTLAHSDTVSFTIADGGTLRLQQLLAQLGYLPLAYSGTEPAGRDLALAQPGTLTWRWSGLPQELTDQWVQGEPNVITKGAVMMFETENGLTVDGTAGPKVWATLLADVMKDKANTEPVTYVLVTKVVPEHLTAWVDGNLAFQDVPVNTGVPGATTVDGTFEVFQHVRFSDMKGVNVTGSHYTDPDVPWASYFNGGDALHGFPRATYGWPQSNGCVEMRITTAGKMWPYTPIGTLVTVQGPTYPKPPTTTTTTTTTTSTTTTTTTTPTTTQAG